MAQKFELDFDGINAIAEEFKRRAPTFVEAAALRRHAYNVLDFLSEQGCYSLEDEFNVLNSYLQGKAPSHKGEETERFFKRPDVVILMRARHKARLGE